MGDQVEIKKKTIKKIGFLLVLVLVLLLTHSSIKEEQTDLVFSLNETNENLQGEVFINNSSLGKLDNGTLTTSEENLTGATELKFVTSYMANDSKEFYFNIFPSDVERESVEFVLEKDQLTDDFWDVEGAHWTHMPVTYKVSDYCGDYEIGQVKRAFQKIENRTEGAVAFQEVNSSPDISVNCEFLKDCYEYEVDIGEYWVTKTETICAHELGHSQITESEGDKILKANITMVGLHGFSETDGQGMSGFSIGNCGHINAELHEILHAFGYEHTESGIMSPEKEHTSGYRIQDYRGCRGSKVPIDDWIIEDLKRTYS